MFKRVALVVVIAGMVLSSCGFENRKGYFFDNHQFNYVRLEKFKDVGDRNITQPFTVSPAEISTILKMIEIKKGIAFSKDEKEMTIFDSYSIGKLTDPIVKALAAATPKERVGFSFMIKDPAFILRNDRLSNGWIWVEDNKLHMEFDVIYVKLTMDTDKRGYAAMNRQIAQARGLRVALDLQAGQEYGSSMKELVVDLSVAKAVTDERLKKEAELAQKGVDADVTITTVKEKSAKERLKELDTLKKERMITEEEYQAKKKVILGDL